MFAAYVFLVPAMSHCGGGPALYQFDMLGALVNWVEKGTAESVIATGKAFPGRSRPLCAYPQARPVQGAGGHRGCQELLAASHR